MDDVDANESGKTIFLRELLLYFCFSDIVSRVPRID